MAGKCVTLVSSDSIRLLESCRNHSVSETIASLYLGSAPMLLQEMADAVEQGNMRQLSRAAQALASSSASLGAARLASLCRQIAELPSKKSLRDTPQLMQEINRDTAEFCARLLAHIKSPTAMTELSA